MDRAWKSGASATPPVHTENTAGNHPTAGNPGTGTPATKPGPYWFYMITEELRAILVAAGITPDKSDTDQVLDALKAIGLLGGAGGGGIGQLKFPASQNASADANTLDDYEEGSFTAGLSFGGASVGITYSSIVGSYVKWGKNVLFSGQMTLSNKGSSTGAAKLTGLPFAQGDASHTLISLGPNAGMSGLTGPPIAWVEASAATAVLGQGGATGQIGLTEANFTNASAFWFSGWYRASN